MGDEPGELPAAARPAWAAYQAMALSKHRHFEWLQALQEKRDGGATPSLAEQARLDELLAEHDSRVQAFAEAMKALAEADPEASRALTQHLSTVNELLGR